MRRHHLVVAVALLCAPVAAFGQFSWPDGTATSFAWANGVNQTNNFGSPINFGDTLVFFTNFDVATPPSPATQGDQMDVDFSVLDPINNEFASIQITMYGDYTITDPTPTGGNSVEADFTATVDAWNDNLSFYDNSAGNGYWSESLEIVFPVDTLDITALHLTFAGDVIAISDGVGGSASISANTTQVDVALTVIPEPASLALLAMGGIAILRRRW